jgi:hypothetical protein
MTLQSATPRAPWFSKVSVFLAIIAAAASILILELPFPSDRAERRLCDRAVDALLHSKDMVEVQRAGIIIREVNCAMGRRLPENGE